MNKKLLLLLLVLGAGNGLMAMDQPQDFKRSKTALFDRVEVHGAGRVGDDDSGVRVTSKLVIESSSPGEWVSPGVGYTIASFMALMNVLTTIGDICDANALGSTESGSYKLASAMGTTGGVAGWFHAPLLGPDGWYNSAGRGGERRKLAVMSKKLANFMATHKKARKKALRGRSYGVSVGIVNGVFKLIETGWWFHLANANANLDKEAMLMAGTAIAVSRFCQMVTGLVLHTKVRSAHLKALKKTKKWDKKNKKLRKEKRKREEKERIWRAAHAGKKPRLEEDQALPEGYGRQEIEQPAPAPVAVAAPAKQVNDFDDFDEENFDDDDE